MAIRFSCPKCQATITANDQFAGKRAQCTTCSAVIVVPASQPAAAKPAASGSGAETIRFACPSCRSPITAKSEFAGKRAKCTSCSSVVVVPAASQPSAAKPAAKPPAKPAAKPATKPAAQPAAAGETIKFPCPQCAAPITANASFAGKRAKCTTCSAVITIPSAPAKQPRGRSAQAAPTAAAPTAPARKSPAKPAPAEPPTKPSAKPSAKPPTKPAAKPPTKPAAKPPSAQASSKPSASSGGKTIQFACGQCGAKISANAELAGRRAKCKSCSAPIIVPSPKAAPAAPADMQPLQPLEPQPAQPAPAAAALTPLEPLDSLEPLEAKLADSPSGLTPLQPLDAQPAAAPELAPLAPIQEQPSSDGLTPLQPLQPLGQPEAASSEGLVPLAPLSQPVPNAGLVPLQPLGEPASSDGLTPLQPLDGGGGGGLTPLQPLDGGGGGGDVFGGASDDPFGAPAGGSAQLAANPYASPSASRPSKADGSGVGSMSLVATGLNLIYLGLVIAVCAGVAAFVLPWILTYIIDLESLVRLGALISLAFVASFIMGIVGRVICLNVPEKTGAKGLIIGAVALDLVATGALIMMMTGSLGRSTLDAAFIVAICYTGASVLFLLFCKRLAEYLRSRELADRAWTLLIMGIVITGVQILFVTSGRFIVQSPGVAAIIGFGFMIAGLVMLVMYMTLLSDLRDRIRSRRSH